MKMTRAHYLVLTLALTFCNGIVSAQTPPATGTPSFGSFGGGPEIINLGNLNAHLAIPIRHKAGRGLALKADRTFDTALVWFPVTSSGTRSWLSGFYMGWDRPGTTVTGYVWNQATSISSCDTIYSNWTYYDNSGTSHTFPGSTEAKVGTCGNSITSLNSVATDGSGYTLSATGATMNSVISRDGTITVISSPSRVEDRNGNTITIAQVPRTQITNYTDTLGGNALTLTMGTPYPSAAYTYTAPSGAVASINITVKPYSVQTNFGCPGIAEVSYTSINLIDRITLPDQSFYQFSYEPTPGSSNGSVTARLASVTFPTGGTINYSYSGGDTNRGVFCNDGSTAGLTRQTPDGTWTYVRTLGSAAASTTTITDPQGSQTVVQFQGIYEVQRQVYQGAISTGNLLTTITTCYNGNNTNCTVTAVNAPITQQSITTQLGSGGLTSKQVYSHTAYGMRTELDDYDYGSGAPGAPLRKIITTYASLGNINSATQTEKVQDGVGNTLAQTTYNYDETTPTATSGTPQHASVSGSRGNLTSINYPVSGLTSHFTYYDTGTMNTATDVNGAVTTNSYTGSSCGNSFPTSVSEPLSLSRSMTWNCTGGVQLTTKDENNQITTTAYNIDPYFWRPDAFVDQLNNQTNFSYQPNPTYCCPTMVASVLTFNNSQASDFQYKDGLGRTYVDQRAQSPSSSMRDTVSYTFDANGRPYSVSMSCTVVGLGTCPSSPATTQTYDALNRPLVTTDGGGGTVNYSYSGNDVLLTIGPAPSGENTKRRQLEYDALGRLTSVCEITGATGSGTCGQNSPQTGFWTKYTYDALNNLTGVTQNAQGSQQTRSYSYDAMSRLTSETNPESGTTTYTYDSATGTLCAPNSSGDLIKRVDANGNWTCYNYDALHRVTDIGNNNQSATNPARRFRYDNTPGALGSRPPGVSVSNVMGRLTEAETDNGGEVSAITDEWFSYTARGEVSDIYESTPHSGGYYHTSTTYWPNGVVNSISGPAGYFMSWNVDGEGRVYTTNPYSTVLASTFYNAASQPTQVNFGTGDSDSFSYDPNTNRMTQYQFKLAPPVPNTVDVRFTNDSCSACWGPPVGGGDRNLFINSITVGSTTIPPNDPSVSYVTPPCNEYNNGVGQLDCNGDMISTNPVSTAPSSITVNAYGSTDYNIYPHMQLLINGSIAGEWDVTGSAQNYTVTTASLIGQLAWNANGTLGSQNITDAFNAADTQNCAYQYDDVTRLTSANCGSAAAQTFSFDAFGNISKSGSPYSFQPTYSSSTNRITNIGSFTPTYDGDGNVTNDGLHTYSWDAYGRPVTIDSVNLTYDALGRMVEQNRSGAYTQIAYSTTGFRIAILNGQSFTTAFVPLAGGVMGVWSTTQGIYLRHPDWLGSSRLASRWGDRTMLYDGAYTPFGEPYAQSGATDLNFTSMDQDTVSGLYDFPAREYSIQGRWPSPDPAGFLTADYTNPQSWNGYAYVQNNPVNLIDPLGLCGGGPGGVSATVGGRSTGPETSFYSDPCNVFKTSISLLADLIYSPINGRASHYLALSAGRGGGGRNQGSTSWLVTKVFFQAMGRNFVDEFQEGGCVNTFINAFNEGGSSHIFNALNLSDPAPGLGPDDILREGGKAAATVYALNQALYVPLRSSVYRGILEGTETAAAYFVAGDLFLKSAEGVVAEAKAMSSGACH
jgi:RHS repeat-associated protein